MKIYTKTGDGGLTGLLGGTRVSKTSARIAAIGDIDELNATLGLIQSVECDALIGQIQSWLFDLGAELACPPGGKFSLSGPGEAAVRVLEASIDDMTSRLPELKSFILPAGSEMAARLHLARCVCRRAERTLLGLHELEPISNESRVFLNRLSDWLFVAARMANMSAGVADVPWQPAGEKDV